MSPNLEGIAHNARTARANRGVAAESERPGSRKAAGRKPILESISCRWHFPRCRETLPPRPAEGSEKEKVRLENRKRSTACSRPLSKLPPSPGAHAKACIVQFFSVPPSSIPQARSARKRLAAATFVPPPGLHARIERSQRNHATLSPKINSHKESARNDDGRSTVS